MSAVQSVAHGVEWLAFLGLTAGAFMAGRLLRFILTRDSLKLRARAHGPFRHGPGGAECLKAAVASSQIYSREHGYGMWILNVSCDHPDSDSLPRPGFHTNFLQKWLTDDLPPGVATEALGLGAIGQEETVRLKETAGGGVKWAEMSPEAYCDPRGV
jgi:hypothetical protein